MKRITVSKIAAVIFIAVSVMHLLNFILGAIGPGQVVIIVAALLLLFGGRKIPELMKGLGSGIKEFKKASKEEDDEEETEE